MKLIIKSKFNLMMSAIIVTLIITSLVLFSYHMHQNTLTEFENTADANSLPGIGAYSAPLKSKIAKMYRRRDNNYQARTRHLDKNGKAKYTNRLFLETSPYLLQHAHNPVNWFAWGKEGFDLAKKLNRPVLLSVGYSTCHWCHVMEKESFEDEEIARYMNENFIAIKVDREERPDVDAIYMTAVQALTGRGGWPMTVLLTPDRKPFYAGTYFPARDGDRGNTPGLLTVLQQINTVYREAPEKVKQVSQQLTTGIQKYLASKNTSKQPLANVVANAAKHYSERFDDTYGGLGTSPKFPSSLSVRLLLRNYYNNKDKESLNMVTLTLKKMAAGGMHDHIGGGFHRYSTDKRWLVPHFEKMLYDNALLSMDYLEAYELTRDENFAIVTRDILSFVSRDMTSPEGGFYSASDADSKTPNGEEEEGYFYTWTKPELISLLGKKDARVVATYYGVTDAGNFDGRTILNTPKSKVEIAESLKISEIELSNIIEKAKITLYQARKQRPQPLRDEKIITAWNGLMISAYARAGFVLDVPRYKQKAITAANFILNRLYHGGRLYRSYKDGRANHQAYISDYAFFIAALIDLYESTHEMKWLTTAMTLQRVLEEHFEDKAHGGFYRVSDEHEQLLVREKPSLDGAIPSGNSVEILNLLRLYEFTLNTNYLKRADKALAYFSESLNKSPSAYSEMLLAVDFHNNKAKGIVIVTPDAHASAQAFLTILRQQFLPNKVFVLASETDHLKQQSKTITILDGKRALQNKTTAYVCEQSRCKYPTHEPEVFSRYLLKRNY